MGSPLLNKNVLGISFGYHDSSISYLNKDDDLICLQEERFSRIKFDRSFPVNALDYLTKLVDLDFDDLLIMFYENPNLKRNRQLVDIFLHQKLKNFSVTKFFESIYTNKKNFTNIINNHLPKLKSGPNIQFSEHHLSHAASSFYSSSFENSSVLVIDSVGEKISTSIWSGRKNSLKLKWTQTYPNSLGIFYSSFSNYCGFKVNSGEYKFMGLSPYGKPLYAELLQKEFIHLGEDGRIRLHYKNIGLGNYNKFSHLEMERIFKIQKRAPDGKLLQFHADLAASVQSVLEKAIIKLVMLARDLTGSEKLCMAGGVALNCVANEKVGNFIGIENLHIVPASGDSGTSLGALSIGIVQENNLSVKNEGWRLNLNGAKLGRKFEKSQIKSYLDTLGVKFHTGTPKDMADKVAQLISVGKVGAVFEGKAEFGPRALGNRSIIADPRIINGQIHINLKIKLRESFRPFAPVVLEEDVNNFFEFNFPSPYMLITAKVKGFRVNRSFVSDDPMQELNIQNNLDCISSPIPSVTHLDGSARIQTIKSCDPSFIVQVLHSFKLLTGVPILVNTSFNVRGEPIVDTPEDALNCLATTGLDFLWIEGYLIFREEIKEGQLYNFSSRSKED